MKKYSKEDKILFITSVSLVLLVTVLIYNISIKKDTNALSDISKQILDSLNDVSI